MIGEGVVFGVLVIIMWKMFISVLVKYIRIGRILGFRKVDLLYKPFTGHEGLFEWSARKYGHSYGFYFEAIRKNPMLKILQASAKTRCFNIW